MKALLRNKQSVTVGKPAAAFLERAETGLGDLAIALVAWLIILALMFVPTISGLPV